MAWTYQIFQCSVGCLPECEGKFYDPCEQCVDLCNQLCLSIHLSCVAETLMLEFYDPCEQCVDLCNQLCLSIHLSCVAKTLMLEFYDPCEQCVDLCNQLCLSIHLSCVAKTLMLDMLKPTMLIGTSDLYHLCPWPWLRIIWLAESKTCQVHFFALFLIVWDEFWCGVKGFHVEHPETTLERDLFNQGK